MNIIKIVFIGLIFGIVIIIWIWNIIYTMMTTKKRRKLEKQVYKEMEEMERRIRESEEIENRIIQIKKMKEHNHDYGND